MTVENSEYVVPTINIIIPPPDVRNIIDRTADYIAKFGYEFESKIKEKDSNAEKFNFITPNNPYNAYYVQRVKDCIAGKVEPTQLSVSVPTAMKLAQDTPKAIQEALEVKDPPAEFEFIADAPTINSLELDIVKLTARFVARNGRQFLTQIMNREMRNYLFDFLKTQHNLFGYFTKLVEQYSKILLPDDDMLKRLKEEAINPSLFLKECNYRVAWEKHQARIRKRDMEIEDREKVAYAQIDWHDFVVVETVDQPINEVGNFPPLTLPEQVGARLIAEERGENVAINWTEERVKAITEEKKDEKEEEEPEVVEEDDMEVSDNEEEGDGIDEEEDKMLVAPPPKQTQSTFKVPPPSIIESNKLNNLGNPDEVIVKPYDPKAKAKKLTDEYLLISPLEEFKRIVPDQADKHIKVSLLNPEWKNERDRNLKKNQQDDTPYAPGNIVSQNLQHIADRRTDIFGLEETAIGKKVGERINNSGTADGQSQMPNYRRSNKYVVDAQPTASEAAIRRANEINNTVATNPANTAPVPLGPIAPPPPQQQQPPLPPPPPPVNLPSVAIGPQVVPQVPPPPPLPSSDEPLEKKKKLSNN